MVNTRDRQTSDWFFSRAFLAPALVGLLIRLALMPFAMHVDKGFVGDIIAVSHDSACFISAADCRPTLYPPLALLTIGAFQAAFLSHVPITLHDSIQYDTLSSIFPILFTLKSLYLVFDLLGAVFLVRIFKEEQQRRKAWLFWLFNPVLIYGAYVHGQFDLIPVLFVTLSLYSVRNGKAQWAAFWLGIAGCFKNFPLLLLLPLVMILGNTWRERSRVFLFGIVPYVLLMIPFSGRYLAGTSSYSDMFFVGSYSLGLGAQVYVFLAFYGALLWYLDHRKAHTFEDLWRACFAILLVYYQFSYFDLHYWAWIVPFAAIYFAERPREATPFYVIILAGLFILTAPTPLARFLAPISPRFFLRLPSLMEALNPYLPMLFLTNVVRSLLAGTCFFLAYRLLRDMAASRRGAVQAVPGQVTVD